MEHLRECDQHPDNDGFYPCSCPGLLADLAEHHAELEFASMHEEGE